jgi:predicted nucleic acid-binding protein
MPSYLLDTNVVSEMRKSKPHGAVLAWLSTIPVDQLFISAVTLGELQAGVELTRRQDVDKASELEAWIDGVPQTFQILPMDTRCFREWGRLMHRKAEQLFEDGMIAATARVHGLTVATRNERHFKLLEVPIVNPFQHH